MQLVQTKWIRLHLHAARVQRLPLETSKWLGAAGLMSITQNELCTCTWQEVSVGGQDVVYKDIIEPLESVSVSITPSDKDDITLYGEPVDVSTLLGSPACIKRADAVHTFMLTNMP